ncbi:hypothetical protein [Thioalkalivibrio sp. ALJ24]|uniref:hypothetical protein n=1 Tax=Thioalkalivibrio sp. ALJ24 TaxID=545276 RepID=UPI00036B272C|nr:hypothetical protein [Thioalkalivibrio sp. ALJ24]
MADVESLARRFNRIAPWLVAGLLLAAVWVAADRYLAGGGGGDDVVVVTPEICDLNAGPCAVQHPDGGEMTLEITPRPVPMLRELELHLRHDGRGGSEPEWIELDFAGVEMYMGFQRPRLERVGPGEYAGTTTLPICTTEAMTWAATVLPEGDGDAARVQYRFVTARDH